MAADFSLKIMEARRKRHNIFQVLEKKNCQLRILYLAKISFGNKGEINTFSDKGKLRKFVASRLILKGMAKGSSLNRREMVKEGTLRNQEERKNTISKNKYNRLSSSS